MESERIKMKNRGNDGTKVCRPNNIGKLTKNPQFSSLSFPITFLGQLNGPNDYKNQELT